MPNNELITFRKWLPKVAGRVHDLVDNPSALERFHKKILRWYLDVKLRDMERKVCLRLREEHIDKILTMPRLRDKKAGPPEAVWQWWETYRTVHALEGSRWHDEVVKVRGWGPPDLIDLQKEYWPLPLSERTLEIEEQYTLLAAIHDYYCKGVKRIDPWADWADDAGSAPEDGMWEYVSLCDQVVPCDQSIPKQQRLRNEDWPAIEAFFADVEADLAEGKSHRPGSIENPTSGQPSAMEPAEVLESVEELRRRELAETTSAKDSVDPRADSDDDRRGRIFRRSGSTWETAFDGPTKHLQDLKGMLLIHHLLRHPGQDVDVSTLHAVGDFMGQGVKATAGRTDSGPVISNEGERACDKELRGIEADLDKAKRDNNLGEIDRLTHQKDEIVAHLVKAKGLGGRRRLLGSDYKKLVNRVGKNIRNTLEKIRQENEPLWRHLDASLRTGDPCSYRPEKPVDWQL